MSKAATRPEDLDPIDPVLLAKQPTINLITLGHVAHGKSRLMETLSGTNTCRFLDEKKLNMTIELGYASVKVYQCRAEETGECPEPGCFAAFPSTTTADPDCATCADKGRPPSKMKLIRHFSFVDAPGHSGLMTTMLRGSAAVDGALLLIAANEKCPMPQTTEHMAAAHLMGLNKNLVCLQNKVDLLDPNKAMDSYADIQDFLMAQMPPANTQWPPTTIPISAQLGMNIDLLLQHMVHHVPVPKRELRKPARLTIIRSFDVNMPGSEVHELNGGVAGGTLIQGVLRVGDLVEIRPGIVRKDGSVEPVRTKVVSLYSDRTELDFAVPGGLIGVGTMIDPVLSRQNRLVGSIMGHVGSLPPVFMQVRILFRMMRKLPSNDPSADSTEYPPPKREEHLTLNIGASMVSARVVKLSISKHMIEAMLQRPVCADVGTQVAICRLDTKERQSRLIGAGYIQALRPLELKQPVA